METMLDALRSVLSPYVDSLVADGSAVVAVNRKGAPLPCKVCHHSVAYRKGKAGDPLCAACLSLSAKMPRHSDPLLPEKSRGLSLTNPSGGGVGLLLTQDSLHLFVKEEKFDLVVLDEIPHTRIPFVTDIHVLTHSIDKVLLLPDGAPYFWGIIKEADIYPMLQWLRDASWDIAQDWLQFRGEKLSAGDTRESWRSLQVLLCDPEYKRTIQSFRKLHDNHAMEEGKRQKRIEALPWDETCWDALRNLNQHALQMFF